MTINRMNPLPRPRTNDFFAIVLNKVDEPVTRASSPSPKSGARLDPLPNINTLLPRARLHYPVAYPSPDWRTNQQSAAREYAPVGMMPSMGSLERSVHSQALQGSPYSAPRSSPQPFLPPIMPAPARPLYFADRSARSSPDFPVSASPPWVTLARSPRVQHPVRLVSKSGVIKPHRRAQADKSRPFWCGIDGCPSRFNVKGHLTQHVRYVHDKVRPHACPYGGCDARFGTRFARNQHVWTVHEGRKPFVCGACGNRFGQRSHLNRHAKKCKAARKLLGLAGLRAF